MCVCGYDITKQNTEMFVCLYDNKNLFTVRLAFLYIPVVFSSIRLTLLTLITFRIYSCVLSNGIILVQLLLFLPYMSYGDNKQDGKVQQGSSIQVVKGEVKIQNDPAEWEHDLGKWFDEEREDNSSSPALSKVPKIHADRLCAPCSAWLQMGRDPNFATKHKMDHPYHAGKRAETCYQYLSYDGNQVILQDDNCMCMSCHKDAATNCEMEPHVQPRWHNMLPKRKSVQQQDIAHFVTKNRQTKLRNLPVNPAEINRHIPAMVLLQHLASH